ncbi:DUF6177 family protein [Spelaeicoccus albus]|uniref:Uncharacterized protein n=1 Tax=Spelaeicoccus albus TaxID=1280376 RepID=A0A7Z0ABH6_9MICO|nr:DUF6177 family protein [Spelaeicoccus albus]NYI66800.1 hypothetical protein [Spelaeicoccus albus]
MSNDFVAVCRDEPTQDLIGAALQDTGGGHAIRTSSGGTVLHVGPGGRVVLELPRRIRVPNESIRLFGAPDPNTPAPSWWIDAHARDGDPTARDYAATLIRSIAAHATGFTVGVTDDGLRPLNSSPVDDENSPVVVRQAKPTVYLSEQLAREFTGAVESGRQVVVLTEPDCALTLPAGARLAAVEGSWVVDNGSEYYDGYSGQTLKWDGASFTSRDDVSDAFTDNVNAARGALHVQAEVLHPASAQTRIGDFTAAVFRAATGSDPEGWGVIEPASEPWHVPAVTELARSRAPSPTTLAVVGSSAGDGTAVAVLTVARSKAGVHESVELLAEVSDPLDHAQRDDFAAAVHAARARTAVAGHHMGLRGTARSPHFSGITVPAVAVFGPESLADTGADHALELAGDTGRLIGTKPVRSLVVRYADEPVVGRDHPLKEYANLVDALAGGRTS